MKSKTPFWQRIGLQDWFLKKGATDAPEQPSITPNDVYKYILDKFNESIGQLSFAGRIVFYHEYIIAFNPDDYREFIDNKKGIFGLIVQESVKKFYEVLKQHRSAQKTVEPSSSKWVFRFVAHPDYAPGDKGFIGKLLPGNQQKEENLRVTFIPRQTGIAQTSDISPDILKGFVFYSEGYYEVPYQEDLLYNEQTAAATAVLARYEAILPDKAFAGKRLEYFMKDEEIIVTGKEDKTEGRHLFRIPSEWVNSPHLRIQYKKETGKFYLTSFGEKTMLNERELRVSTAANPIWTELPLNSRLVLNGIIGINVFKS